LEVATVANTRGKNKLNVNGYVYEKQKSLANNIVSVMSVNAAEVEGVRRK